MANSTSASSPTEHLRPTWLDQREFPYVSHFVDIDGNSIHYIDEGRGPTLLFLHGLPLWSFQYRNVIRTLRTRFRCIALDYPGFGLSVAAAGFRNSLSANARLVERFIRELKLDDVTIVLHDGQHTNRHRCRGATSGVDPRTGAGQWLRVSAQ
jgi:haloalkane dehalogenase